MQRFHEARRLQPEVEEMPPVFDPDIFTGMYHVLGQEVGNGEARTLLTEAFTWDMVFHRPQWRPELFDLPDEALAKHYHKTFKDLMPFICLFRRLLEHYGEERAQELTAKLAVPASVPYLAKTFVHIEDISDIDQFRQELADYLGDGEGFDWTEEVSDDQTEVRYRFTRCVYIEVLRAYGMTSAAMMSCYCDHVIFDNAMPEIYFKRDHCKGVGDTYCDHCFKIRTPEDAAIDDLRYGDTEKAPFDARGIIDSWAQNYRDHGGRFEW